MRIGGRGFRYEAKASPFLKVTSDRETKLKLQTIENELAIVKNHVIIV